MKTDKMIRKLREEIRRESLRYCQAKAEELQTRLILATPVDTGAAASGWNVAKTKTGNVITNSEEHIRYLNQGSSVQAPARFIEKEALQIGKPSGVIVKYK